MVEKCPLGNNTFAEFDGEDIKLSHVNDYSGDKTEIYLSSSMTEALTSFIRKVDEARIERWYNS